MGPLVTVTNSGPGLVATSYWQTGAAGRGLLYVSINAGAIRVLVPEPARRILAELPPPGTPAEYVQGRGRVAVVYLDDPDNPYVIDLDIRQVDRRLPADDDGRIAELRYYTQAGPGGCRLVRKEQVVIRISAP